MRGLMMDRPLLISSILEYGARYHGEVEIVSRSVERPIHRTTYRAASGRATVQVGSNAVLPLRVSGEWQIHSQRGGALCYRKIESTIAVTI